MPHSDPVNGSNRVRVTRILVVAIIAALFTFTSLSFIADAASDQTNDNSQVSECANIPSPARGITLRIVNFHPQEIYVGKPGFSFTMLPGETRDVIVVPGELWTWAPNVEGVMRTRIVLDNASTQCYVIGTKSAQPSTPAVPAATTTAAPSQATDESTATEPAAAEGMLVSLQSYNFPDRFIRHGGLNGYISPIVEEIDQQDATFRIGPGLADAKHISFEAINFPNYFLVVEGGIVVLRERVPNAEFDANATFIKHPGLSDPTLLSLESYALPGQYIRHSSFQLYVNVPDGSDTFNMDATFKQTAPQWTPTEEPTAEPSVEPTAEPTGEPSVAPTAEPTGESSATPTSTSQLAPSPTTTPEPQLSTCTQEDFLQAVNDGEKSGTITLDGSCHYMLTSATDSWEGGSGASLRNTTVVEGNGAIIERSAGAPNFRILLLNVQNGTVLRNVTFRNGAATSRGGAIYTYSSVTLENVVFEGNTARDLGGAIYSQGNLVLRTVSIEDSVGSQGGAIAQLSGATPGVLTIDSSRIINNHATEQGGAIFKQAGKLEITNTVFAQNRVEDGNGAAIFIGGQGDPTSKLTNCTITDNGSNPGSAITLWSSLTLRNTIIANHETALTVGGSKTVVDEDHNLFANNNTDVRMINSAVVVRGDNSVQVPDPQFVDAAALNYALKESSPAVDKGTDAVLSSADALATDAANVARPYSGTLVDIGAYELQGKGGPSLSIVKQVPYWIAAGVKANYSLIVANDGIRSGEGLVVADVLPDGANYVTGSATKNGTFANGRLTWDIGTLAPGESTFISYSVVASQTLVSLDYSVQSTTEPAVIAQGKVVTSPLKSNLVVSLGFLPRPDGFSFENYGDSPDSDLTADDMIFIFGEDIVCKSIDANMPNSCVLTATAEAWRKKWLTNVSGGHCAGMAMGSLDIFANASVAPADFQPGANFTFDLTKPNARKYIALYATTQGSRPGNASTLQTNGYEWDPTDVYTKTSTGVMAWQNNPVDVLDVLTRTLSSPNPTDLYRLSVSYYPSRPGTNGGGGHTVVPYAVEMIDADNYLIYVYDNNYPNNFDRVIKINRNTGNWSYVTATRPDQPENKYYGDKTSNNLSLSSWQWAHTFPKECAELCPPQPVSQPITGTTQTRGVVGTTGMVEIQLDGEGYPLVTRSDGKQIGFDLNTGEWISEIEGAQEVDIQLGLGLNIPPAIQIPHEEGMTYGVQIAPRETAYGNTEAPANVNIAGPGFATSLTGLVLNSPESQPTSSAEDDLEQEALTAAASPDLTSLNVDPDNKRIVFEPGVDDAETPSISLAVSQADGSDFSVDVKNVNVDQGHAVALTFDAESQSITIEGNSADQTDYQVEVNRINTDGTQDTFISDAVSDDGAAGVTLKVGEEWTGEGSPEIVVEESSTLPEPVEPNAGSDTRADSTTQIAMCDPADVPVPTHGGVIVRFVNESGALAVVYWQDFDGNLVEFHRLDPDGSVDQETFESHEWVVEDEAGNVLLDYTASAEETQCILIGQP